MFCQAAMLLSSTTVQENIFFVPHCELQTEVNSDINQEFQIIR